MFLLRTKYFFLFLCLVTLNNQANTSTISLTDLRCENLVSPLAIDNTQPHFSWKMISNKAQTQQAYYEIQVVSDSLILKSNHTPDLWNSGKIKSSTSIMVTYGGKRLSSC